MNDPIKAMRDRLEEVINEIDAVDRTKKKTEFGSHPDPEIYVRWLAGARTVVQALANGSHYEREFEKIESASTLSRLHNLPPFRGLLRSLLDDVDAGRLRNLKNLVRAEVFVGFLEQAEYLLSEGFHLPAAVLAGAVLEDHLRKLCDKHKIARPPKPKLETMNVELCKAGAYNSLKQKQVTAWAAVRNNAAHGKPEQFTAADVKSLINDVLRFIDEFAA